MGHHSDSEDILDDPTAPMNEEVSKSARKRDATAVQKLGERLIELGDADLAKLSLPEELRDAVRAARIIRSRGALARQRQYIGRLMRDIDPAPLLELLEGKTRAQAADAARFRRVEAWRERLIAEGDSALTALGNSCTLTPEQHAHLVKVLLRARSNSSSEAQRVVAARQLFRALRELL